MLRFARSLGVLCVAALPLAAPAVAQDPLSAEQKDAVRALVRETLIHDPTLLKEAVQAMQEREQKQEMDQAAATIRELGQTLTHPKGIPAFANQDGDVTVVEFSDYNCGYCKRVFPDLWSAIKADGKVRLVVIEYPILGPESVTAARAALAAIAQNRYEDMHRALMDAKGRLSEDVVLKIAQDLKLDVEKLKRDMKGEEVERLLAQSFHLGQALGVNGTPAFVVGPHFVPGALPASALAEFIAEARKK